MSNNSCDSDVGSWDDTQYKDTTDSDDSLPRWQQ